MKKLVSFILLGLIALFFAGEAFAGAISVLTATKAAQKTNERREAVAVRLSR